MTRARYVGALSVLVIVGIVTFGGLSIAGAAPARTHAARRAMPGPSVTVTNTPANPVPVASTDNPAYSAIVDTQGTGECSAGGVDVCTTEGMAYTVPAGKELVLQETSFNATVPSGQDLYQVAVNTNGGFDNWIAPQHETTDALGAVSITGSTAGTFYAAPGQRVYCEFRRNGTAGSMAGECTLNGYLVTLP